MGADTYYATIAGGGFALVVFGAGILGSRFMTLIERARVLDRERGDFTNRSVSEPGIQMTWAERARRNDLADLHDLAKELKREAMGPVVGALVAAIAALLPFLGWPHDTTSYRAFVLAVLVVASALWIAQIVNLADSLAKFTWGPHDIRQRERDKSHAEGQSFLESGDPRALDEANRRLETTLGIHVRWWQVRRRIGRRRRQRAFQRGLPGP